MKNSLKLEYLNDEIKSLQNQIKDSKTKVELLKSFKDKLDYIEISEGYITYVTNKDDKLIKKSKDYE